MKQNTLLKIYMADFLKVSKYKIQNEIKMFN